MKPRMLFSVLLLALTAALSGCGTQPVPSPGWAMLPAESGIRMYGYASEFVKIMPRDAGTPGAGRASRWIAQEIRRMGLTPIADCWTEDTAAGRRSFCNVYADIPGTSGQTILLISHYDTKAGIPNFQGANDGGSSTAVLLGLIEHLIANPPAIRDTIRFAFLDGEEARSASYRDDDGLHGSKHLAREYLKEARTLGYSPLIACIVIDMVGDRNLTLDIPRNVSPWLGRAALKAVQGRKDLPIVSLGDNYIIDDHLPFLLAGFPAVNFIDFEYGSAPGRHDYWHTEQDSIDKLSAESLHKTGGLVLALLQRIEADYEVPEKLRRAAESASASAAAPSAVPAP